MREGDLPARITALEREIDRLQAMLARLLAIEAGQRSRFEFMLYSVSQPMGPDGYEREEGGATPTYTPLTVTDTAVELWAGSYELRITVSAPHGFHDENQVTLEDASPYNGTYRVRVVSPTEFAILSEDETFTPPDFGTATVTKEPGAVKLNSWSVQEDGPAGGFILATAVWWGLAANDAITGGSYYLPGGYVLIGSDPLSRDPQHSLFCITNSECWVLVED